MHKPTTPEGTVESAQTKVMSTEDLIRLGAGDVAYIRTVKPQELSELFPGVPPVQDSVTLYALLNADGSPILLADSREAALANAFEHDLTLVSVH